MEKSLNTRVLLRGCTTISGKKTLVYIDDTEHPASTFITYDHVHTMEEAIMTLIWLGFLLRDLNQEFCA
jgi:hypothetical protein